jgi:hypothetical protein
MKKIIVAALQERVTDDVVQSPPYWSICNFSRS